MDRDQTICPTCRVTHVVPREGQFPISYALEDFIKMFKIKDETEPSTAASRVYNSEDMTANSGHWKAAGLSNSVRFLLQDQEVKVLDTISSCQEIQAQLDEYRGALAGWCEQQQLLENSLQRLIEESRNARMLVRREEAKAVSKIEDTKEKEKQLHCTLGALRRVSSAQEALPAIDNAEHRTDETRQGVKECQRTFPDLAAAAEIKKVSLAKLSPDQGRASQPCP